MNNFCKAADTRNINNIEIRFGGGEKMDTLYLKLGKHQEVHTTSVKLKDIAEIWCKQKQIAEKCGQIPVFTIDAKDGNRKVGSILQIIPVIERMQKNIQIENLGEIDFVVEYRSPKPQKVLNFVKAACWA